MIEKMEQIKRFMLLNSILDNKLAVGSGNMNKYLMFDTTIRSRLIKALYIKKLKSLNIIQISS